MITIIAAASNDGIIGIDNNIPWIGKYKSDMKRFKKLTTGGSIIMGSNTWRSLGEKPLPNRINYVVSSILDSTEDMISCNSVHIAIKASKFNDPDKSIWIIGGASIYLQSMNLVDYIDLTIIPENFGNHHISNIVRFPWINPTKFELESKENGEQGLIHLKYKALDKIG